MNGNGVISKEEMEEVVGALFKMQFSQTVEDLHDKIAEKSAQIFTAMDRDMDGEITQEEFMAACEQDKQMMDMMSN